MAKVKFDNTKRHARLVTKGEDLEYLFSMTEEDACKLYVMMDCFGDFGDGPRFNPYDLLEVPAGKFGPEGMKNKNQFTTTVGLWVFNKAFIEPDLVPLLGYVNTPITKKQFKKLNKKISYAVIEDDLSLEAMKKFIIKTQKFQPYCNILSPSFTPNMFKISDAVSSKKDELFKKYEKELSNNDPATSQAIEKELIDLSKDLLKDDPSIDMIESGAKADWGNNFSNVFVMRGAVKEADPSKGRNYSIIKGNYLDGVKPEEYAAFADSLTGGPYARAKKTEVGGYIEKTFVKAFEHIKVLPEGTDCHTKKTITVTLDSGNIEMWMYSYVVEGNTLTEITSKNMNKFIGKTVKLRFSALCESKEGICSKCAGSLFNRINITNVGIATYNMASVMKNISMKSFHDSTVKIQKMSDYGYKKIFGI